MLKKILRILAIFGLGIMGGMIWQAILLPYMARHSLFGNLWFIREFQDRETIVFPTEQIYIQENFALVSIVEKVEKLVVGISAETAQGKSIQGSGLILASDGLVVTLADLLPKGAAFSFFLDSEKVPFEILKSDPERNLVLIKIEKNNLPTCNFAEAENIKRGQRVFLVGAIFLDGKLNKIVNQGIIKYFDKGLIRTNMFENYLLKGSPLFDIEGNALGINIIDLEGKVTTIPISQIREFAGF